MSGLSDRWRSWPRARRRSVLVLLAVCAALAAIAGTIAADDDGLVYYRTPTEVMYADSAATGETVRVGGLVVAGSVRESAESSSLVLTDGSTDVEVQYAGRMPDVVQEGQGAVVEGRWQSTGVLQAEEVVMRHSNEYRAPEEPLG